MRVVEIDALANKRSLAVAAAEFHCKVLLLVEWHLGNDRALALQYACCPLVEGAVVVGRAGGAEYALAAARPWRF